MRIAVVANGEWDREWGKQALAFYDTLIAADGGANSIIDTDYIPDALVGDLDSIKPEYLEICRNNGTYIRAYPSEKDETDLELALEYAAMLIEQGDKSVQNQGINEFDLLGATGGRIDHFLGNLSIMLGFLKRGFRIRMRGSNQELWLLEGQKKLTGKKGQKVSIIPMTAKTIVRTEGLYYPLHHEILYQESPRGISNVFLGEDAIVEVAEGTVLVITLSPDNIR